VVTAGPAGEILTVRLGRERHRLVLRPLQSGEVVLENPSALLGYYGTALYRLRLSSRYGGEPDGDRRNLGSFVRIILAEEPPPSGAGRPGPD